MSECKFWTWTKATGKCYLKTSKDSEPEIAKTMGPNYGGNSDKYVSSSKNCIHVSKYMFCIWLREHPIKS